MTLGAAVLALLIGGSIVAPSARAAWADTHTFNLGGSCSTAAEVWVDANGHADPSTCITQDEYTTLEEEVQASGEEAAGDPISAALSTQDAGVGTSWYDSLSTASDPVKSEALDMAADTGEFAAADAIGSLALPAAAAVGTFYIGWKIGGAIANVLGISQGTDSCAGGACSGQTEYNATGAMAVKAGFQLDSWTAPSSGWLITFNGGSEKVPNYSDYGKDLQTGWHSCLDGAPVFVNNLPVGAVGGVADPPVPSPCNTSSGTTLTYDVYFVPRTVTHLPGPGQGGALFNNGTGDCGGLASSPPSIPAGGCDVQAQSHIEPSDATQLAGASTALQDPSNDSALKSLCAMPSNSFCSGVQSEPQKGWIQIPAPTPNETYAQYVAQLQKLGLVGTVTQSTLSDAAADPSVGPDDVVRTNPATGTYVDPSTAITVYTNPDDSPPPTGGGGAPAAPSLPGISMPAVSTPCSVFPFGIPCWIVNQLHTLVSAAATAPSWTITLPAVFGGNTLTVNLDHPFGVDLGGMMSIVRPVLLFLSFIGLILWVGGMAMGGSTGGGGTAAEEE